MSFKSRQHNTFINSPEFLVSSSIAITLSERIIFDADIHAVDVFLTGTLRSCCYLLLSEIMPPKMRFIIPLIDVVYDMRKVFDMYKFTVKRLQYRE